MIINATMVVIRPISNAAQIAMSENTIVSLLNEFVTVD